MYINLRRFKQVYISFIHSCEEGKCEWKKIKTKQVTKTHVQQQCAASESLDRQWMVGRKKDSK